MSTAMACSQQFVDSSSVMFEAREKENNPTGLYKKILLFPSGFYAGMVGCQWPITLAQPILL